MEKVRGEVVGEVRVSDGREDRKVRASRVG